MKKILLRVKPGAGKAGAVRNEDGSVTVSVTQAPRQGKANEAAIKILADFFDVPPSFIKITHGHRSRNKLVEIG